MRKWKALSCWSIQHWSSIRFLHININLYITPRAFNNYSCSSRRGGCARELRQWEWEAWNGLWCGWWRLRSSSGLWQLDYKPQVVRSKNAVCAADGNTPKVFEYQGYSSSTGSSMDKTVRYYRKDFMEGLKRRSEANTRVYSTRRTCICRLPCGWERMGKQEWALSMGQWKPSVVQQLNTILSCLITVIIPQPGGSVHALVIDQRATKKVLMAT